MPSLCGDLAAGKQIVPSSPAVWSGEDLLKFRPQRFQIECLLLLSPHRQGVVADRPEIFYREGSEIERHAGRRANARNSSFEVILTVSPAWSCAKPMAASRWSQRFSSSLRRDCRSASRITSLALL